MKVYNENVMIGKKSEVLDELLKELKVMSENKSGADQEEFETDVENLLEIVKKVILDCRGLLGVGVHVMDGTFYILNDEEILKEIIEN